VPVHRGDGSVSWLREKDKLSGEDVLPGFRWRVADIFRKKLATSPASG
jgi:hypothetical protein